MVELLREHQRLKDQLEELTRVSEELAAKRGSKQPAKETPAWLQQVYLWSVSFAFVFGSLGGFVLLDLQRFSEGNGTLDEAHLVRSAAGKEVLLLVSVVKAGSEPGEMVLGRERYRLDLVDLRTGKRQRRLVLDRDKSDVDLLPAGKGRFWFRVGRHQRQLQLWSVKTLSVVRSIQSERGVDARGLGRPPRLTSRSLRGKYRFLDVPHKTPLRQSTSGWSDAPIAGATPLLGPELLADAEDHLLMLPEDQGLLVRHLDSPGKNANLLISRLSLRGVVVWTVKVAALGPGSYLDIKLVRLLGDRVIVALDTRNEALVLAIAWRAGKLRWRYRV
jgi:hypothetical protein